MDTATLLERFHPDLIDAVIEQAASEADSVSLILKSWASKTPAESGDPLIVPEWPRNVLLAMNLMVRFKGWELIGTNFHIEAGLPRSDQIVGDVLLLKTAEVRTAMLEQLHVASLRVFCDRFVWIAKTECQVDLGITNVLDEGQLDAIADFLWTNRHALCEGEDQ